MNRDGKDYVDSTQLMRLLRQLESPESADQRKQVISHIGKAAYASFQVGLPVPIFSRLFFPVFRIRIRWSGSGQNPDQPNALK